MPPFFCAYQVLWSTYVLILLPSTSAILGPIWKVLELDDISLGIPPAWSGQGYDTFVYLTTLSFIYIFIRTRILFLFRCDLHIYNVSICETWLVGVVVVYVVLWVQLRTIVLLQ